MLDTGMNNAGAALAALPLAPSPFATREAWLAGVAAEMAPWFARQGHPLPERLRIAVGFPSSGRGSSTIGECWHTEAAADGVNEIWIAPQYGVGSELRVMDILLHELCHAALPWGAGHGPDFRKLAMPLGLRGPMTATVAGEGLQWALRLMLHRVGPMPHGAHRIAGAGGIDTPRGKPRCPKPGRPPQVSRQVKCSCATCGYIARTTRLWIERAGAPICPTDRVPMFAAAR